MLLRSGWAALAVLGVYLILFFVGGVRAAQASGRPIWLFEAATGWDRMAATGFRAAFAFSLAGPLLWLAVPALHKVDPLWTAGGLSLPGLSGVALAAGGAILAFAAQRTMGASWRVGVKTGETGALVRGGLFRLWPDAGFGGQVSW